MQDPPSAAIITTMERRAFLISLLPILLLGAYLRLVDLGGPSLWLDEILHLEVSQDLASESWYHHLLGVREIEGGTENGPLYYRLQIWGQQLLPGDAGVRLFPALIGTLALALMTWAGWLLGGRLLALSGTFILAVSPLHVYFSREGRPYSLLMALALLLLCGLLLGGSKAGRWLAYLGCPLLAYVGLHSAPVLLSFTALSALAVIWDLRAGHGWRRLPHGHHLVAGALALLLVYGLYLTQSTVNAPLLAETAQGAIDAIAPGTTLSPETTGETQSPATPATQATTFKSLLSLRSLRLFLASMTTSGHPEVTMIQRSWWLLGFALIGLVDLLRCRRRHGFLTLGMYLLPAALSILALASVGRWYGMRYSSPALPAFLLLLALGITATARLTSQGLLRMLGRQQPLRPQSPRQQLPGQQLTRQQLTRQQGITVQGFGLNLPNTLTWSLVVILLLAAVAPNIKAARRDPWRKLDWRGVAAFFDAMAIEGEPVIVPNAWPEICLRHYLRRRHREVEFISAWERVDLAAAAVADRSQGWLLTAGYQKDPAVRAWMRRFVPVMQRSEESMSLYFFPDFVTLVESRFAAQRGAAFEQHFAAIDQRFELDGRGALLLGKGWSAPETNPQGLTFRWAVGERAEVALPIAAPKMATLRLRLRAFDYPAAPPQRVELWLNQQHLTTLELLPHWAEHEIEVPGTTWSRGGNILDLRFAHSARPADVIPGSSDRRNLSAAFDYLEVTP